MVCHNLPPVFRLSFPPPCIKPFDIDPNVELTSDSSNMNYTPVFLCHAQLYTLAERYDIPPLKQLALHKLHSALVNFELHPHRGGDISQLIEYVYRKTPERKDTETEPLRNLVAHYVACELEQLTGSKEFSQVLEQGGDFVKDLFRKVVLRF